MTTSGLRNSYDVIVIGSGIAGLSFALTLADLGYQVTIFTKKDQAESNTNYAQGGIACVTSLSDDFELHVRDTLRVGEGLCKEAVTRTIIREGPERVQQLIELGVTFSQLEDGRPSLAKEGGHSRRRILHVKDMTGRAIETVLLKATNQHQGIQIFDHCFAIDLITTDKLGPSHARSSARKIVGLYVLKDNTVIAFRAPVVLLATGGIGQVYLYSTNPSIATGDGIAMAYRCGAQMANMEFIQFHPTTLYAPHTEKRFLISEAVRGEGALLLDANKRPFMKRHDLRGELAPRNLVARAIDAEMKRSGASHLWLDLTSMSEAHLRDRFPHIFSTCAQHNINISKALIPVVPAAHYLCGGIVTNLQGQTSLPGLYACGEVACTGLHGANRLGSNSLLEAIVAAHRAAASVATYLKTHPHESLQLPDWQDGDVVDSDERVVLTHNSDELKRTLWDYVGIVRTTKRLERARTRIQNLKKEIQDYYWDFKIEPQLLELRNMIQVAELIITSALQRKESRGLHYILDFPEKNPEATDTLL